ncbi:hypothetical protein STSO111631_14440 [Stackebrandtia soli]
MDVRIRSSGRTEPPEATMTTRTVCVGPSREARSLWTDIAQGADAGAARERRRPVAARMVTQWPDGSRRAVATTVWPSVSFGRPLAVETAARTDVEARKGNAIVIDHTGWNGETVRVGDGNQDEWTSGLGRLRVSHLDECIAGAVPTEACRSALRGSFASTPIWVRSGAHRGPRVDASATGRSSANPDGSRSTASAQVDCQGTRGSRLHMFTEDGSWYGRSRGEFADGTRKTGS